MRKSIWLLSAGLFAITTPAFAQSNDTDQGAAQPTDGATAEAAARKGLSTTTEPSSLSSKAAQIDAASVAMHSGDAAPPSSSSALAAPPAPEGAVAHKIASTVSTTAASSPAEPSLAAEQTLAAEPSPSEEASLAAELPPVMEPEPVTELLAPQSRALEGGSSDADTWKAASTTLERSHEGTTEGGESRSNANLYPISIPDADATPTHLTPSPAQPSGTSRTEDEDISNRERTRSW